VSSSHQSSLWAHYFRVDEMDATVTGRSDYAQVFGLNHPIVYTFYIFIATFVVAGFIEEVCKYFGYKMVEHPDFYSRTEIEQATSGLEAHRYPEDDDNDEDELSDALTTALTMDYSHQYQSKQNRCSAIALAMVSTAIGFACCENLMYIFLYAGQSFHLQLGVLIERSFFPIHPVLAAIQSIGVCRRDLEHCPSAKLGRIIYPAVCFHGTFDFLIVFLSFMGKLVGQYYQEGDLRVSNTAEFLSVLSCVWVMFGAIFYLYNELGKQHERLAAMDREYTSPPVDRATSLI
jgi:RsiW-degrading membrane proteinase PrsW (M82 family)